MPVPFLRIFYQRHHRITVIHSFTNLDCHMGTEFLQPSSDRVCTCQEHLITAKAHIHIAQPVIIAKLEIFHVFRHFFPAGHAFPDVFRCFHTHDHIGLFQFPGSALFFLCQEQGSRRSGIDLPGHGQSLSSVINIGRHPYGKIPSRGAAHETDVFRPVFPKRLFIKLIQHFINIR